MTEITLKVIAERLELILADQNAMRDEITVLTGICIRLDGAIQGLIIQMRGVCRLVDRLEHRVRKLEDAVS